MKFDLALLPPHHLRLITHDPTTTKAISSAFEDSTAHGLYSLTNLPDTSQLTPSVKFWHEFASSYLQMRKHLPQTPTPLKPDATFSREEHVSRLNNLEELPGSEHYTIDLLYRFWKQLDRWVCDQINQNGLKIDAPAQSQPFHPYRLHFHLNQNNDNYARPFNMFVSYHDRAGEHRPFKDLYNEFDPRKEGELLLKLLQPLNRVSEASHLIAELIETEEIFKVSHWSCKTAYIFLREVGLYQRCGIHVDIPKWWQQRLTPEVKISLEQSKRGQLSAESLLDFKVDLMLGDQSLTQAEWSAILTSKENLIKIQGQWIEIQREQLMSIQAYWEKFNAKGNRNHNMTLLEGLKLLGGQGQTHFEDLDTTNKSWAYAEAGPELKKLLRNIAKPEHIDTMASPEALNATLRPYQRIGISWLHYLTQLGLGACLADDMGLGKTIQIIGLLLHYKQSIDRPSLLVLPTSLLQNWQYELDRFAPSLTYLFAHPSIDQTASQKDLSILATQHDLVITSYGMLSRYAWINDMPWHLVILDEAQAIKNPTAKQTVKVKQLNSKANIILTGTPIENQLTDLWSLFDFILPGLLGSARKFKQWTKQLKNHTDNQYNPLKHLVQPYILRRSKSDKAVISDLPEKLDTKAYCNLNNEQIALYSQTVETLTQTLGRTKGMQRRGEILGYITRFKQICNHPALLLDDDGYSQDRSGKFERLRMICETINEKNEKVLIYTQYRTMTQPLHDYLTTIFGREGLILNGSTPAIERQQRVNAFQQADGPPFFVLSLKAGGIGLNLTAASHVIHFDRWWNPAVENQATDRAFRIGQDKRVMVYKFICSGTIEDKIDALIESKVALSAQLLEEGNQQPLLTELDDDALIDLVTLDISKIFHPS